jgi:glyceraldehyde 3-phosphate dehydrogenase
MKKTIGINGFGRIGKLAVWQLVSRKYFDEIVVNIGRNAGTSLADVAHYAARDSSYGALHAFLYGHKSDPVITNVDDDAGTMVIDGTPVRFMREARNPADIAWQDHDVRLVVDTTGQFLDPTLPPDVPKGSVRGHLEAGAEAVIVSAPFKIADSGQPMPEDAVTTVMGINANDYDPRQHRLISNASCTTTCLAHMVKPLIDTFGYQRILSASMATIHAATGSQQVLDRLPETGKTDLRKSRSIMNNIILTTTGAAKALSLVIPEMEQIGFIAESVRIPTSTGSLIILVLDLQEELSGTPLNRHVLNDVYKQAAADDPNDYLCYTEEQNVSGDIISAHSSAAIIEAHETHTRTAEVTIDMGQVPNLPAEVLHALKDTILRIPVTQAVVYGWYDNEMGSYVNMLCDRAISVFESID